MANGNETTIVGNVTRDPEIKFLPSGMSVANFGIANNRSWKKDDEWQEETSFFNVSCFGALAENVVESCPRGTRVMVYGRLQQRSWENDDGEKRSVVEIVADEVAPSLKYATAEVSKNERTEGSDSSSKKSSSKKDRSKYADSEEPF